MTSKLFHLGDILSITTSRLVSPDHMDGIYKILNHLTGDNLYTHQLPEAADTMREALFEQLPFLREIVVADDFEFAQPVKESVEAWLQVRVSKYGEHHAVTARPDLWETHDMLEDLLKIRQDNIILGIGEDDSV